MRVVTYIIVLGSSCTGDRFRSCVKLEVRDSIHSNPGKDFEQIASLSIQAISAVCAWDGVLSKLLTGPHLQAELCVQASPGQRDFASSSKCCLDCPGADDPLMTTDLHSVAFENARLSTRRSPRCCVSAGGRTNCQAEAPQKTILAHLTFDKDFLSTTTRP